MIGVLVVLDPRDLENPDFETTVIGRLAEDFVGACVQHVHKAVVALPT